MPYLESLHSAIRTRLAVVWPSAIAHGFYESEHADLIPWSDLTPDYGVIVIPEMTLAEWGLGNAAYEAEADLYLVQEIFGPSNLLRPLLEAARDDFLTQSLTYGQVLDVTAVSWSASLPPNAIFLSKGMAHRAGLVKVKFLVGEIKTQ